MAAASHPLPHSPLGLYLVVNHISKKANVRTLMTSAAAFGAGVIVGASSTSIRPSIHTIID